ncbi:dna-directed rna polymerase subunit b, partial [Tubulinosema ratisbonensis]
VLSSVLRKCLILFFELFLLFLRKSLQNKLKIDEEEKREVSEVEYLGSIFKTVFRERGLGSKEACERLFGLIACHLENYHDKVNFLVLAIRKLILLVNSEIKEDDPDDPSNHEVIGVSHLLSFIVKEKLNETLRNLVFTYAKKKGELNLNLIRNLAKKIEPMVCQKVENFLATGNFNTLSCSDVLQDKGFVILAERLNFLRFISHFRCVNRGSFFTNVKTTTVRKLRPESYGFICPVHTPDGTPCGILNHLSSEATVIYKNQPFNTNIFSQFGVSHQQFGLPVVLDGKVIGYSKNTKLLAQKIREEREKVEVALLPEGLFIFTGVGRYSRAIINLQTKKEENIGIMEQLYLKIIPYNKKVTDFKEEIFYQEKSMTSFLSLTASLTPFSDYNQSPRNVYQCQMAKQSMGINCHSLKYRNDSKTYQHFYNQIPIVQTNNYSKYDLQDYPLGVNTIIAVLSYTAYDMEDAMIINKSSKERGMFNGFVYKTEIIHLEKNQNLIEIIEEGTFLTPNSFFYSFSEFNEKKVKNYNGMEGGFVDKIILADSLIIVRLRIERNPNIGDKFCSRHGQKGVCSFHYPAVDLPFSESGLVPDVIINPHAFPSRMTIGMMIESLAGKSGCLLGKIQNGNSFMKYEMEDESVKQTNKSVNQTNNSVNQTNLENSFDDENSHPKLISHFGNELLKCGFNYFGNETMYSGVTGTPFKTDIFIGVVYYQRLRHMVNDKFQVRIQGPVQPQTKQPIKGRSKLGGVRLGEMERDALLAHGASYILNDRFMTCSDGTLFYYCVSCKSILFSNKEGCLCGNKIIKEVYLPYVYKYLCTELMAMNVRVRLE